MKRLIVFDFDHTILDDNTDTAIFDLAGKDGIPQDIKAIQYREGWTAFIQSVFVYLFDKGVKSDDISDLIRSLPAVPGMIELIKVLHKLNHSYDLIIISDSNSEFIRIWLERHKLNKCFLKVYTNPAHIDDGMYRISPYHHQDSCKLSTKNLCKGQIMEDFIKEQHKIGVNYDDVTYIGDGVNDLCPALRLKVGDLVCPRNGFKLHELVEKVKNGKSLDNSGKPHFIDANIFVWDSGEDILKRLEIE